MNIELRVIDSFESFENLHEDWDTLYESCQNATIFLSWDWMFTWWEVFHKNLNTQLFIICLYQDSNLVGIAPFQIIDSFPKSIIQGRTLCFIGDGELKNDKIVSEYMDFIVEPQAESEVIASVSKYLFENKDKWDFADFEFLIENSLVSKCFQSEETKVHTYLKEYGRRFYISNIKSCDEFYAQMGSRWRKMFIKKSRKLQNDGEVSVVTSSDVESVQIDFKQLVKMHDARWKNRTDVSIFESKLFNQFHLKLLERLVPKNKAKISTLKLNDNALACYYYFTDKNQLHYYQSGFYTENANRYSPLFLLICTEIKSAIKNKLVFDFMFDEGELSYKKEQYAANSQPMYRLKWSPYKSRMMIHNKAKALQTQFLKIKAVLS